MSSNTTIALLQTAYDRLLAYVDAAGDTLSNHIGSGPAARLYIRLTPDSVAYPYVVIRATEAAPDLEVGNLREMIMIEARCVHRSEDGTVEQMADLVEEALLTWVESSSANGLTFGNRRGARVPSRPPRRQTAISPRPPSTSPA